MSTSLIFVYLVVRSLILREPLNFPSLIFTFRLALYESLVNTLMNLRSKEESLRAKMIEERGLIRLLKLEE